VCQSGGLGTDIIRRGQNKGLRFSGLVTIGNAVDLSASELLEFFLRDPHTRVIGLYLESARDGRRLFELLRQSGGGEARRLREGGRREQGQAGGSSHAGGSAGGSHAARALSREAGLVLVAAVDSLLAALLVLQCLDAAGEPARQVA